MKTGIENEKINLANLARGSAQQKFENGLREVIENIMDPDRDPDMAREIIVRVKFEPNKDQYGMAFVDTLVKTKLAPEKSASSLAYFGRERGGDFAAYENDPEQLGLGFGGES